MIRNKPNCIQFYVAVINAKRLVNRLWPILSGQALPYAGLVGEINLTVKVENGARSVHPQRIVKDNTVIRIIFASGNKGFLGPSIFQREDMRRVVRNIPGMQIIPEKQPAVVVVTGWRRVMQ